MCRTNVPNWHPGSKDENGTSNARPYKNLDLISQYKSDERFDFVQILSLIDEIVVAVCEKLADIILVPLSNKKCI